MMKNLRVDELFIGMEYKLKYESWNLQAMNSV
jgi:hypothetical protein